MAKIYGLFGTMTGKVADAVMLVRNGEQIVRKYQPVVSNPSTPSQVAARARLKLLSQLSAIFGSVIAIPREGSVSSRNLFTKDNYPLTSYESSKADINLAAIQLTRSVVALPGLIATGTGTTLNVALANGDPDIDSVVYVIMARTDDEKLRLIDSAVVSTPGSENRFSFGRSVPAGSSLVVYAYGIRANSDAGRAMFGNLNVPNAQDIAQVVVSRTMTARDLTLTETRGIAVTMGD